MTHLATPEKTWKAAMDKIMAHCNDYYSKLDSRDVYYAVKCAIVLQIKSSGNPIEVLDILNAQNGNVDGKTNEMILGTHHANPFWNGFGLFVLWMTFVVSFPILILWSYYSRNQLNLFKTDEEHFVNAIKSVCNDYIKDMESTKMPIFDMDDLGFFRMIGLSLRHVDLDKGIQEWANGDKKGDALSLSNFGRRYSPQCLDYVSSFNLSRFLPDDTVLSVCNQFQKDTEGFINNSFAMYHRNSTNYNDAAFLLIDKGSSARNPYDFVRYKLGKSGSPGFFKNDIYFMLSSNQHDNQFSVEKATRYVVTGMKTRLRQLKIEQIVKLKEQLDLHEQGRENIQLILTKLVTYYEKNIFVQHDIFLQIFLLLNPEKLMNDFWGDHHDTHTSDVLDDLIVELNATDETLFKGCFVNSV